MTKSSSPQVAAVAIILACFAWIGGISYGVVCLMGLSSAVGWGLAGGLGLVVALIVGMFLLELRNAVDLTDCDSLSEFEERPLPAHRRAALAREQSQVQPVQPLRVAQDFS